VAAIPAWLGDAAKSEGRPTRLKLASELLQVETGFNNTQRTSPSLLKLASELLQLETGFNNTQRAGPPLLKLASELLQVETGFTIPRGPTHHC
jgi:hypothetical protein